MNTSGDDLIKGEFVIDIQPRNLSFIKLKCESGLNVLLDLGGHSLGSGIGMGKIGRNLGPGSRVVGAEHDLSLKI